VNLWTVGCADPRLTAQARSPMDKPGKTLCVSPTLPTGRRLSTSFTAQPQHQGLNLSARWTTAEGQLVAETEQALVPTSATVTTFSLQNGEPWPVGKYQLVVSIDKQPQNTLPFEIR